MVAEIQFHRHSFRLPHPGAHGLDRRQPGVFRHGQLPFGLRRLCPEAPAGRLRPAVEERQAAPDRALCQRGLVHVDHERLRGLGGRGHPDALALLSEIRRQAHPGRQFRPDAALREVHDLPLRQAGRHLRKAFGHLPRQPEIRRQRGPVLRRVGGAQGRAGFRLDGLCRTASRGIHRLHRLGAGHHGRHLRGAGENRAHCGAAGIFRRREAGLSGNGDETEVHPGHGPPGQAGASPVHGFAE